ncbi:MAG: hypothetical protein JO326_07215 [Acetobacteraceae bacterium]|nr:hypothetical protein [Acetobacteraceae bacterium]
MKAVLQDAFSKAGAAGKHPKHFLFFSQTKDGQLAADAFLTRLNERAEDRDAAVSNEMVQAQLAAITAWGSKGVQICTWFNIPSSSPTATGHYGSDNQLV